MSDSNQAIFFWGIIFHDRDNGPKWDGVDDNGDWEVGIAKRLGVKNFSKDKASPLTHALEVEDILIGSTGDQACNEDIKFYVTISESLHQTWTSKKVDLPISILRWEKRLRAFCDKVKIPWQEPGWHLAAYYG